MSVRVIAILAVVGALVLAALVAVVLSSPADSAVPAPTVTSFLGAKI